MSLKDQLEELADKLLEARKSELAETLLRKLIPGLGKKQAGERAKDNHMDYLMHKDAGKEDSHEAQVSKRGIRRYARIANGKKPFSENLSEEHKVGSHVILSNITNIAPGEKAEVLGKSHIEDRTKVRVLTGRFKGSIAHVMNHHAEPIEEAIHTVNSFNTLHTFEAFVKKGTYGDVGDALRTKKGMAGLVKSNNILNGHKKATTAVDALKNDAESKERQGERKQKQIEEHSVGTKVRIHMPGHDLHGQEGVVIDRGISHGEKDITHMVNITKGPDKGEKTLHSVGELRALKEDGGGISTTAGMDINASGFPAEPKRKKKLRQKATIFKRKII